MAAFDFDGTLVPGDSLAPFLLRLLGRPGFARAMSRSSPAMLARYRREGRDGAKAALLARTLAGCNAAEVEAAGRRYGTQLVTRIRPAMGRRIDWHRHEGHRLVLVSASLAVYLEPWGEAMGFDAVIATRLEVGASGQLTGLLAGANVRAGEKARLLTACLAARGWTGVELWAYGDSAGDRELLAMADHPRLLPPPRPWRRPTPPE